MSMLIMLKEGGSLGIDSIGLPIQEDLDLLPIQIVILQILMVK